MVFLLLDLVGAAIKNNLKLISEIYPGAAESARSELCMAS